MNTKERPHFRKCSITHLSKPGLLELNHNLENFELWEVIFSIDGYVTFFLFIKFGSINSEILNVFQNFGGERDVVYCGIFDGHGPSGHKVAHFVRDTLPSKLSWVFRDSQIMKKNLKGSRQGHGYDHDQVLTSLKARIVESFRETDERLDENVSIDSYSSGSTNVSILRQVLFFIRTKLWFGSLRY